MHGSDGFVYLIDEDKEGAIDRIDLQSDLSDVNYYTDGPQIVRGF